MSRQASSPRSRSLLRCVGALLLLVLAGGCTTTPVQRRYYTLTLPAAQMPDQARYNKDLWVREVEIAPVYNRPQVVYRYTPNELQYFNLEYWADRPQRMMTGLLAESMRDSGLFRNVSERLGATPPDYVLEATIESLEQLDGGAVWFAHLAMSLRLTKFGEDRVVWQYAFDQRRPLESQDVGLTARAMSDMLREQLGIVSTQLDAVLGGRPVPHVEPREAPLARPVGSSPAGGAAAGAGSGGAGSGASGSGEVGSRAVGRGGGSGNAASGGGARVDAAVAAAEGAGQRVPSSRATSQAGAGAEERREEVVLTAGDAGERETDWRLSAQFTSDPTRVPPGMGAIFLPALSGDPDREPVADVYRGHEFVTSGAMGHRIPVVPGRYEVRFGSGPLSAQLVRQVTVEEGVASIVEPDWSTLDIEVVTEKFIPFRGSYEIINMQNLEYLGVGFGADEELGEQTQVWVLKPGLYKIVQPGSSYRARTNFATVQLQAGDRLPFTLVLDETSRDFLGAGVSLEVEKEASNNKRWSLRSTLGGTLLWNKRSAGLDLAAGTTLTAQVYADNLLRFVKDRHQWTTRLEIEQDHSLQAFTDAEGEPKKLLDSELRSNQDRLYFNSIYIYDLLSWAGPYVRVGLETALFDRYTYFDEDTYVLRVYDGSQPPQTETVDRLLLGTALSPLDFKEGVGVNFRMFHNRFLDLDLRAGLGGRQYLARGFVTYMDDKAAKELAAQYPLTDAEGNVVLDAEGAKTYPVVYQEASDLLVTGPETTILASGRLTRYLQLTSELDALIPFQGTSLTRITWRNSVSLRLASYASLVYTLNLDRNPSISSDSPLAIEHGMQLRFSFEVF